MTAARIHSENWQQYAACRGMDQDLFVPDVHRGEAKRIRAIYKEAKKVCAACPVTAECLAFALKFETRDSLRRGVYGGLTPDERNKLMRGVS